MAAYGALPALSLTGGCNHGAVRFEVTAPGRRQRGQAAYVLDPAALPEHIDALYRAAWAMCGSRADAEDLVQTTFVHVLKRPRIIRQGNERAYLLRALRNAYATRYRAHARDPVTLPLLEDDAPSEDEPETTVSARDLMEAIASAPPPYRDAVIAVDVLGMSYGEAARSLRSREATIASRLHRGRQHVMRSLADSGVELGRVT